ncbi:MAG: protein YgfX [Gammaproteobacteria bacterium]
MSSHKYNKPLNLNLEPSKYLFSFIVVIHLLAYSVLLLNLDIYVIFKLIIFVLISISLYRSLIKSSSTVFGLHLRSIELKKEMEWLLINSDKQSVTAMLQKNWFILSGLVILYFKDDAHKNITTVILPDMIKKNDLRKLKLYLSQVK